MQCVILAGGLGTRMRPLTSTLPKTLLPVCGKPFAWHQLHWLAAQSVTEVVYSIGHQGDQIRRYWDRELPPVDSIRYIDEGPRLRGTGGALRLAFEEGALRESFLVLYGDSFLPIPLGGLWSAFESGSDPVMMTVHKNDGRWDRSNVIYAGGRVRLYDKNPDPITATYMRYIDYGLSAVRRRVIEAVRRPLFDLAWLYRRLSIEGQLAGYEVAQRFYEIGSPQGLRELEQYLASPIKVYC